VVRLKLYKGSATVASRRSPESLYHAGLASFGEEATYNHADAEGFIKLFGLPARVAAERERDGAKGPEKDSAKGGEKDGAWRGEDKGGQSKAGQSDTNEVVTEMMESVGLKTPAG
jgi:hypothetical protein